jgi:hypothetical protein
MADRTGTAGDKQDFCTGPATKTARCAVIAGTPSVAPSANDT